MRVLLTDTYLGDPEFERCLLAADGVELLVAPDTQPETLASFEVDAILNCVARIPASVIQAHSRLLAVARYGIGVDNIDVSAATEAGVLVSNVPDYSIDEVATHALALILDCSRNIARYDRSVRSGSWEWRTAPLLRRTTTETVGILGLGRIGREMSRKARAVGFKVVTHDPFVGPSDTNDLEVEHVRFEELLRRSDYLTLHVPLTTETAGIIGSEALKLMKPTAYIINAGRGKLVDTTALLDAIKSERLAGAALDVFETEPLPANHDLISCDRVLLTPHAAWYSEEALAEARSKAVTSVLAAIKGETPAYLVNPEALNRRRQHAG